jgi:hypothetical protein
VGGVGAVVGVEPPGAEVAEAVPVAAAVGRREAARPQAVERGTARWGPHPAAVAASAAPRWARRAGWGAESDASQGRAAEAEGAAGLPCRANQAARGVAAAASSLSRFCLIGVTWRVNVEFVHTNCADRGSTEHAAQK